MTAKCYQRLECQPMHFLRSYTTWKGYSDMLCFVNDDTCSLVGMPLLLEWRTRGIWGFKRTARELGMSEMLLYVSANRHSQCMEAENFRRPRSPVLGSEGTGMPLLRLSAQLCSSLSC